MARRQTRPSRPPRAKATPTPTGPSPMLVCAAAWAVPGAGHVWLGRHRTGGLLAATLLAMFLVGLALEGELFGPVLGQPLVTLSALADVGIGVVYFLARAVGAGGGRVVAATYEFGNTFLVVAGLLNALVVLDAYDIAVGRK